MIESNSRYGDIDFSATRAFSDEMNYAATIHLNVANRDDQGQILDRDAAIEGLTKALLAWEENGQKVVRRVYRREEIYTGEAVDWSPDLVLELHEVEGYTYTLLPSGRVPTGQTWRRLEAAEHAGGKGLGMNGSHRQHGLLVLWGSNVREGVTIEADMADCLPTLFAAMGHAIPEWWEGRVLREALEGVVPMWVEGAAPTVPQEQSLAGSDAQELEDRLRSLGYL